MYILYYRGLSAEKKHCLDNVGLIPPCDRVLLEMLYLELDKWTISSLREYIINAETYLDKYYNQLSNEHDSSNVSLILCVNTL